MSRHQSAFSQRHQGPRSRKSRQRRRCRLEQLENRQLLAAEVLFADSFENGGSSNDWVGNWVEDSQDDWFRSTQRSTDGSYSAEVDGRADNATLTLSDPIDLSGYDAPQLTFDWLIEGGFDGNEYLALDISPDGGASWSSDVVRLDGNVSAEDIWHSETVDLSSYASTDLLVRFRSSVNRSNEDANVDNVTISGTPTVNQPPLVDAGPDQMRKDAGGNGDEFVTLTGSASDSDGTIVSYEWTSGSTVLGTTAQITPTLAVGTHALTLTVTDDDGATATDTVIITINEVPKKPVKVFLMAGHSNLAGTGYADNLDPAWNVPQDDVWIWLDHNMDGGQWTTVEPGHGRKTHAPHPSEPEGLEGPDLRVGAELSLARTLADAYPDHQIALIKHARGGAAIADHFHPDNIGPPDSQEHMWSGLTMKIDESLAVLDAGGYSYEVAGMFMAIGGPDGKNRNFGSSDPNEVVAGEQEALARAAEYAENFTYFMQSIRGRYAENLPFVNTLVGEDISADVLEQFPGAPIVRDEQLQVDAADPRAAFFEPTGLTKRDANHYDAMGLVGLGTMFANNYLSLVASTANVATIDYPDFSDSTRLNLIADASTTTDNRLRLTPAEGGKVGGAWFTEKQFVSVGFETTFEFQLTEGSYGSEGGSDGFAFVIQNFADNILGGRGGHLGYHSMHNSVAIEFDTSQGGDEPSDSHVSVHTRGTLGNSNLHADSIGSFTTSGFKLDDGNVHTAKVSYTPGTLSIFLDDLDNPALNVPIDLGNTLDLDVGRAYVGFTAATGGGWENHDILSWEFSNTVDTTTTLGISDTDKIEGDVGDTVAQFEVTRLGDLSQEVTLDWSTAPGSAIAGTDYTPSSGQVVFAPGESTQMIEVPIAGDLDQDDSEDFFVNISLVSGSATLVNSEALGTILNDDTSLTISDDVVTEGSDALRFLGTVVESESGGLKATIGISYGPDGNLYLASTMPSEILRYDAESGAYLDRFAENPGNEYTWFRDMTLGPDGNFYLTDNYGEKVVRFDGTTGAAMGDFVTERSGGLETPRSLRFGPDDNLYVTSASTDEVLRYQGPSGAEPGAFMGAFVASGSGGLDNPAGLTFGPDGSLYVASGVGAAKSVLKYDGTTGSFVGEFIPNATGGVSLLFGPDRNDDGTEDLYVSDASATNSVVLYDGATGEFMETLVPQELGGLSRPGGLVFDSDDNLVVFNIADANVLRYGAASQTVFTVSLSKPSAVPVTVDFSTIADSAAAGLDFEATSGTITFAPGVTSQTILVPTLDDGDPEADETFHVSLSNAVGATLIDDLAIGTIIDDGDVGNQAPIVDAGVDQSLSDNDGSGSESVTVVGAASDSDGAVASVEWSDGTSVLGTAAELTTSLPVGTHTLTFTAIDDEGASASDSVTITVVANQGPSADAGNNQTVKDTDGSGSEIVTLVGSGFDPDGSIASYQWTDGATVLGNAASLSPLLDVGTHTLTLTVTDNGGLTATDTVVVVVEPNAPPVANDQSVSVKENTVKVITLSASDVEGDPLTYSIQSGPSSGTLSGSAPNLSYTPQQGFTGSDSFTFLVNDGINDSNLATVTITVADNLAPVADPQSVSLDEDSSLAISLTGSDPDGDPISYVLVDSPTAGSLSGSAPNLTYTPDADFNGSDSFTFLVNDGTDDSALATVAIDVTPVNDPPVAFGQSLATEEDTSAAITLAGSDIDGDALDFVIVDGPAHGSLSGSGASRTYTPDANFNGTDSFTFRANDGVADSPVVTVSLTVTAVNDAPVAQADSFTVEQDTVLSVPASGVLGNDSDVDGDSLSALAWSGSSVQGGQVVLNSDGSLSYTPPAGFTGTDSFEYRASDGNLESEPVSVTIEVTAANQNGIYVYDIRFERYRGQEFRALVEIRSDSNGDGQGGSGDDVAAGVEITVEFDGQIYSGLTDSNGIFRTAWVWKPGSGSYANVVDLALADYHWNPLTLDLEDDSDGDGRPDASL